MGPSSVDRRLALLERLTGAADGPPRSAVILYRPGEPPPPPPGIGVVIYLPEKTSHPGGNENGTRLSPR
jgi:hypothetical protein